MPYSRKQKKAAQADLGRARAGKSPRTFKGMSQAQLRDYATTPIKKKKHK